jgi:hypothetical protein
MRPISETYLSMLTTICQQQRLFRWLKSGSLLCTSLMVQWNPFIKIITNDKVGFWLNCSFGYNGNPRYNAVWPYLSAKDLLRPNLLIHLAITILLVWTSSITIAKVVFWVRFIPDQFMLTQGLLVHLKVFQQAGVINVINYLDWSLMSSKLTGEFAPFCWSRVPPSAEK